MVYIALVVHGSQFEVRLQLATVVEDGVGGEECGLFGDEGTLLHLVGQSSPLFVRLWPFAFSAAEFTFQPSVQSLNLVRPPVLLSPLAGVSLWQTCRDVGSVVGGKAGFCVLPCVKIQKQAGFLRYYVENMWAKVCRFQKLLYFCTAFERKRHDMRK